MPSIPDAKVEKFVSGLDSAPHLRHVWFDAKGQRLAATDGHRLMVARALAVEGETSGFIPVLAFETIRKMFARHEKESDFPAAKLITMRAFAEQIIIASEWTHETYTIDRPQFGETLKFPDFDSILPKRKGPPAISVSRSYLTAVCKEIGGDSPMVSLWLGTPEECVMLAAPDSSAVAIVMPMKSELQAEDAAKLVKPKAVEVGETVSA